uniref:Uncharacterized protein n=1 Tax=Sinocyclocheilus grahami TaxID=75366 RepID=A0A672JSG7_SINGR
VAGMASEPGTQSRVMFQTKEEEPAQRKLGKLTVKYNRKDLQRRLDIEEWIDGQLRESERERERERERVKLLQRCLIEDFINGLLYRMKGLRKMSGSLKK